MVENKRVRVAVDAMGGDFAPEEIVKGAVLAARKDNVDVILTGPRDILERELAKYKFVPDSSIHCVEAKEVIAEGESPALAVRHKRNSSIAVAAKLVEAGEAQALVGAGATGAVAVSALHYIGMVEGMERPAIGGTLGGFAPNIVVMDLGANVDCKAYHLLTFAIAGCIFAEKLLNISNPTVGLVNVGVEEGKGNETVREAYALLKDSGLNFVGNIEGGDVLSGQVNVVVCDGFVGNVVFKFYESIGDYALEYLQRKLKKYPPLRAMAKALFNKWFPLTKISYEGEEEGGGILWGVNGVVRVAHGSSRAPHIANAITSAKQAFQVDIVGCLRSELAKFKKEGKL